MNGDPLLYKILVELDIAYAYHEHPPAPTIEIALNYWKDIESVHCKNIFLRNHKGNQHYLVILKHDTVFDIHLLEKHLKQGKLSFASSQRMEKFLGVTPGSVSPFGLIHDLEHHVIVYLDDKLKEADKMSFHPNENTASLVIKREDLIRFINHHQNKLYYFNFPSTEM